jgi:predicted dehydrogenase
VALLNYPDGSVAKIAYVTRGDPQYPKEVLEVFGDGKVARMDNFRRAEIWRRGKCRSTRARMDKGQEHELEAFVQAVRTGGEMPITLDSLISTTACTLAVGRSVASGRSESVAGWDDAVDHDTPESDSHYPMRAAQ